MKKTILGLFLLFTCISQAVEYGWEPNGKFSGSNLFSPLVQGGTSANGNLLLNSTSNATKGYSGVNDGSTLVADWDGSFIANILASVLGSPFVVAGPNGQGFMEVVNAGTGPAQIILNDTGGTFAAPNYVANGQEIADIHFTEGAGAPSPGISVLNSGSIRVSASQVHSNTQNGTEVDFYHCKNGTVCASNGAEREAMRITGDGNLDMTNGTDISWPGPSTGGIGLFTGSGYTQPAEYGVFNTTVQIGTPFQFPTAPPFLGGLLVNSTNYNGITVNASGSTAFAINLNTTNADRTFVPSGIFEGGTGEAIWGLFSGSGNMVEIETGTSSPEGIARHTFIQNGGGVNFLTFDETSGATMISNGAIVSGDTVPAGDSLWVKSGNIGMNGNAITGNSTASGALELRSTSNATKGFVQIKDGSSQVIQPTGSDFISSGAAAFEQAGQLLLAMGPSKYGLGIANANTGAFGPEIFFEQNRGTSFAAPAYSQTGEELLGIYSDSSATGSFDDYTNAFFQVISTENQASGKRGAKFVWTLTPTGTAVTTEAGELSDQGMILDLGHFNDTSYSGAAHALVSDTSKNLVESAVTGTELGYVSGVTSSIQTQLNGKQPISTFTVTTTNATPAAIATISTASGSMNLFEVVCSAQRTDTSGDRAAYKFAGSFYNIGGTATRQGSGDTSLFSESSDGTWSASMSASSANVVVSVMGAAGKTVDWKCVVTETSVN